MKKLLMMLTCASVLVARIDPFFLPQEYMQTTHSNVHSSQASSILQTINRSKTQSSRATVSIAMQGNASSSASKETNQKAVTIDYGFLRVTLFDDRIALSTQDRLKKQFLLDSPKKIVFDFAAKRRFSSKRNQIKHAKFTNITLGAHPDYYRLAVAFKGTCKNRLQRQGTKLILFCE